MCSTHRKEFSGLYSVEGSAFAQVVGDHPEMQSMGHRQVSPEPPDKNLIVATGADSLGIMQTRPVVLEHDTRRLFEKRPGRLDTQRLYGFQRNRDRMTVRERHIGRGRGDGQVWEPKQFACLQNNGHFVLRIGIVEEIPTLWQAVEGDLVREDVGLRWPEIEQVA